MAKRISWFLLTVLVVFGTLVTTAGAAEFQPVRLETLTHEELSQPPANLPASEASAHASGSFDASVKPHSVSSAYETFYLEPDETVVIQAFYSPVFASVDFGLIAPDGLFYSANATNGRFYNVFRVNQRGAYSLAIRNNSDTAISVNGNINY